RGDSAAARAGRAQRRRHDRVLPPLRRDQRGRYLQYGPVPEVRSGARRDRRDSRGPEPDSRSRDSGREPAWRHGRRAGPRAARRRDRRRELSRHGQDRPRPRRGVDRRRQDARRREGLTADARLRRHLFERRDRLDGRRLRRSGVSRPESGDAMKITEGRMSATRTLRLSAAAAFAAGVLWLPHAQSQPPAGAAAQSPRDGALFDITGQWVAVVNEDWRWRMVTPPVGDVSSIPVNARGRREAAAWDLERDRAEGRLCKAFGAPGLIRQPTRLRIEWEDDD